MIGKKIYVGMSGGVDSSVAAAMLKEEGYDVTGVFMKCFVQKYDLGDECVEKKDLDDARKVAKKLDIPFKVYNFQKEYEAGVVDYFEKAYARGITPNPDVMCNRVIKFDLFLKRAKEEGADYIATGHYVQKVFEKKEQKYALLEGIDPGKDQSYFLWTLNQGQIKDSFFPIGKYRKLRIREIAKKYGLHTSSKKDSQGICFLGKFNINDYLKKFIPTKEGLIKDLDGNVVGKHEGTHFYTIGQRKGIGVGATGPYYVVGKDIKSNILKVTNVANSRALYEQELQASDVHWISGSFRKTGRKDYLACHARIRYHHLAERCKVFKIKDDKYKVIFERQQRAVTSGQSVVFYKKRRKYKVLEMLGGGVII